MSKDSKRGKYTSPGGSSFWEYVGTMSCSLMIFSVGCVAGWNSPTLVLLMGPDSPIPLTPSEASTLSSMTALGHALAPGLTIVIADKLGRKNSLLAAGVPTIITWGLIAVSNHIIVLLVARLIGGLSLGLILCFPPMYLGEIASKKFRGAIGMVCGTMLNAGLLVMFIMVPYLSVKTTACICLSVTIVSVATVSFIPESPYFLAMVGRLDEAEEVLEKLRGKTDVVEELELIKMTISQKAEQTEGGEEGNGAKSSTLKRLFTVPGNRKALFINMLLMMVLQFGSYISLMIYGQIIFNKMKTGISSHVCSMLTATLQLIFNILTALVIDKLGRRPLICISGIVSGACLLSIGTYFYLLEYTEMDVNPYAVFATCAVFANIIALNVGLVPMQQVLQSEIFATDVKGLATCIVHVTAGVMATIGVKSYLMLAETWGFGHCVPFFGFFVITWIGTALILKLLPETRGKTLFEIQKDLNA